MMSTKFLCYGILLAAGQGKRFDATGLKHKLLQSLSTGQSVVHASAACLQSALPDCFAVVGSQTSAVQHALQALSFPAVTCDDAELGMAHSLRTGLLHLPVEADAFIIALADMPFVRGDSIRAIAKQLAAGAGIVVPVFNGQRGNPVGFAKEYRQVLLELRGDRGARQLLQNLPVTELPLDDPGILRDVDFPEDLR